MNNVVGGPIAEIGIDVFNGDGTRGLLRLTRSNNGEIQDWTTDFPPNGDSYTVDSDCTGSLLTNGTKTNNLVVFDGGKRFFVMSAFARRTYKVMEKEAGDKRILVSRFVITSVCFGILCLAAIYLPSSSRAKISATEASAISAMRTIHTAQSSYAERSLQNGLAAELSELGPAGANLIDQDLATGSRFGYSFRLIVGPPDASGRAQYILLARPITFGQSGMRSFFVDASGTIRFTAEDRALTAQDPLLD